MSRLEDLLFSFLEAAPSARDARLEQLCQEHPEHADELRALVANIGSLDLLGTNRAQVGEPAAAPETIGPYRILEPLGEGGMGTVYLAEQREPVRRRVALKVVKLGMDTEAVLRRFELERQALAVMSHDCIAKVFDAGRTADGRPYFVMEHVAGIPLTDYCDKHRLSLTERIELFQHICHGVQHAHQKGVLHRDLKPGNVLVVRDGERAVPKIIDFGLARATDHQLLTQTLFTEQGQILGTPEYMSPEQANMDAEQIDTRTDVYSLGVMLYELLSGELPFSSQELRRAGWAEIQRKLREDEPPKPSTKISTAGVRASGWAERRRISAHALGRELRGDLDWIVLRAMAKEPGQRYGSANEVAQDLARHLHHEPVLAGPPSAGYRLTKFLRRYRGQAVAATLVLVAILAGGVAAFAGFRSAAASAKVADARATDLARANEDLRRQETSSRALALVGASRGTAERDLSLSLGLALAANEAEDRPETRDQLHRAARQMREVAVLSGFELSVIAVGFSKDGRSVAVASAGGSLGIFDRDGHVLHRRELEVEVEVATPIESEAGLGLFAACADGRIRVWVPEREPVVVDLDVEPIDGTTVFNDRPAVAPDGRHVLVGTKRGDAFVISVPDGAVTRRLRLERAGAPVPVFACCFAGASGVVLGGPRGLVAIFGAGDVPTRIVHHPRQRMITRIVVDADGTRAVAMNDVEPGIFAFSLADDFSETIGGSGLLAMDLVVTPEGDGFAAGMLDGTIELWRFGEDHPRRILFGHRNAVTTLAFTPSRERLVSGSEDHTVRIWDRDGRMLTELPGHSEAIRAVAVDPAAERVASGSSDYLARLWRVAEGIPSAKNPLFPSESFTRLQFGSEPGSAWVADNVASVIWHGDWRTGVLTPMEATRPEDGDPVPLLGASQLDLDRTEQHLLIGRNCSVDLCDARSGALLDRIGPDFMRVVGSDLTDDGQTAVVVWQGGMRRPPRISVWDVSGGQFVLRHERQLDVWQRASGYLIRADLSPDESSVCVCRYDGSARIYDLQGDPRGDAIDHSVGAGLPVARCTMSRDASMLLTTGMDGVVKLWTRGPDDRWQSRVLTSFETRARNAHFDHDEQRVVVGSDDGVLRVLALDGRVLHEFVRSAAPFYHARFTDDGTHIVATTGDGLLMSWMLDTAELRATASALQIRSLTGLERAAYADLLDESR